VGTRGLNFLRLLRRLRWCWWSCFFDDYDDDMGWFRRVDCSLSVEEALKKAEDENKGRNGGDDDGATKAGTTATEGGMGVGFVEAVRREEDWKSRKLYPERGGEKYKASWMKVLFGGEGREGLDKLKCERNVYKVIKQSKWKSSNLCQYINIVILLSSRGVVEVLSLILITRKRL